jgi:hypothetical protein
MSKTAARLHNIKVESSPYVWSFPGAPVRVALDLSVVGRIRDEIDNARLQPAAGVLLGRVEGSRVQISDVRPVQSVGTAEIESTIVELSSKATKNGLFPVGYYIAEPKQSLRLDPWQVQIVEHLLSAPHCVVLMIRTGPDRTPEASFFFWDEQQFLADFAFLPFPFDVKQLEAEVARAPRERAVEQVRTMPSATERKPRGGRHRSRLAIGLVVAAAFVVATAIWAWPRWTGVLARLTATKSAASPVSLGLRAERSGTDFRITWDRTSLDIRSGKSALLSIQDGDQKRDVTLQSTDLQAGSVLFAPRSDRVQVQLSVVMPDQSVKAESVFLLLAPSGAPTVQPAPAIVPRQNILQELTRAAAKTRPQSAGDRSAAELVMVPPPPALSSADPQTSVGQSLTAATRINEPFREITRVDTSSLPQRRAILPPAVLPSLTARPATVPAAAPEAKPPAVSPPVAYIAPVAVYRPKPAVNNLVRSLIMREMDISVTVQIDEKGAVRKAVADRPPGVSLYVSMVSEQAARLWRFRPAQQDGRPVPSESVVTFSFKP